jgi:hypothetical protein
MPLRCEVYDRDFIPNAITLSVEQANLVASAYTANEPKEDE